MKKDFLNKFKKILEDKRTTIINNISKFAKKNQEGEYEVIPKEYGDSEDENSEEVSDMIEDDTTLDMLEDEIDQIDKALDKIKRGDYGKCSKCGKPIEDKRLEFNPSATYCSKCQNKIEKDLI